MGKPKPSAAAPMLANTKPTITGRPAKEAELAAYQQAAAKVQNCGVIISQFEQEIRNKVDAIEDTKLILNRARINLEAIVKQLGGVPVHDDKGAWVIPD